MIIGTGIDIIEIERIENSCKNQRFIDRVFTPGERKYSLSKVKYAQHLAARFASKEACMKALGKGFSFQDIEVVNEESGKPMLRLKGKAQEEAEKLGVRSKFLSISHSKNMAIAFVLLEGGFLMIKVVSSDEMRLLDKMAIEGLGIPGMVLMENAGRAVYERIVKLLKENRSSYIILLAGKGNNGGDAFVTGRHLYNRGYNVSIFFTGKREILKGDCLENFLIAEKTGITLKEITEEKDFFFFDRRN